MHSFWCLSMMGANRDVKMPMVHSGATMMAALETHVWQSVKVWVERLSAETVAETTIARMAEKTKDRVVGVGRMVDRIVIETEIEC